MTNSEGIHNFEGKWSNEGIKRMGYKIWEYFWIIFHFPCANFGDP